MDADASRRPAYAGIIATIGFFRAAGLLVTGVALLACMMRAVYATPVLAVGLSLIWLSRLQ